MIEERVSDKEVLMKVLRLLESGGYKVTNGDLVYDLKRVIDAPMPLFNLEDHLATVLQKAYSEAAVRLGAGEELTPGQKTGATAIA